MPKIRGIKPEFWTDEDICELSLPARLLFIGLWNYACDNGHLQDKSKQIKMRILPGDDVNVAELLRELEAKDRIQRADGWITVPNLGEHQKIDPRYFTTCDKEGCDDPPEKVSQRAARRAPTVHTSGTQRVHAGARGDGDGDGDGELIVKGAPAGKPRKKPSTHLPPDWTPTEEHAARCKAEGISMPPQVAKFRAHAEANDRRVVNWNAAFTQWLLNVPEWQRNTKPASVRRLPHAHEIVEPPDNLSPAEYDEWELAQRQGAGA